MDFKFFYFKKNNCQISASEEEGAIVFFSRQLGRVDGVRAVGDYSAGATARVDGACALGTCNLRQSSSPLASVLGKAYCCSRHVAASVVSMNFVDAAKKGDSAEVARQLVGRADIEQDGAQG